MGDVDQARGCIKPSVGILAIVGGLLSIPIGLGILLLGLLPLERLHDFKPGFDMPPDSTRLAVSRDATGHITALMPSCFDIEFRTMELRDPAGVVLWQAESTSPRQVDRFAIGDPPEGFRDVVPLSAALDPATTYEVRLSYRAPTTNSESYDSDFDLAFGARTRFLPDVLLADQAFWEAHAEDRRGSIADFERDTCAWDSDFQD